MMMLLLTLSNGGTNRIPKIQIDMDPVRNVHLKKWVKPIEKQSGVQKVRTIRKKPQPFWYLKLVRPVVITTTVVVVALAAKTIIAIQQPFQN